MYALKKKKSFFLYKSYKIVRCSFSLKKKRVKYNVFVTYNLFRLHF